ncbi:MAG: FAD-dependent oxidoreductase [Bryobacteraceae bacterium]
MPSVVVVGAGIIGSSIAWELAERGVDVDLVDPGPPPGQASGAGAGMLAPGAEVTEPSAWSDLALTSARSYAGFVAQLERAAGGRIDYRQCGAVELFMDDAECQLMEARARVQAGMGIESRWLTAREVRQYLPALEIEPAGARYFPRDALVNPRDVVSLLHSLRRPRAERVTNIAAAEDGVCVRTAGGEIRADAAVLAAGAWSSEIAVRVGSKSIALDEAVPVRGHLLGLDAECGRLGPILRHGHTYLLQRRSGFLIAGATEERVGFDERIDAAAVAGILERARRLIPSLMKSGEARPWLGFRPGIAARGPAIGRVGGSRLWTAYGHYRNGILLAPGTSEFIAGEITSSLGTGSNAR